MYISEITCSTVNRGRPNAHEDYLKYLIYAASSSSRRANQSSKVNPHETQLHKLFTFRFIPPRYMFRPAILTVMRQRQSASTTDLWKSIVITLKREVIKYKMYNVQ